MEKIQIPVKGMTCGGCVRTVQRKLSATAGVSSAEVNLDRGQATVEYDPGLTSPGKLKSAIESVGYEVPAGT